MVNSFLGCFLITKDFFCVVQKFGRELVNLNKRMKARELFLRILPNMQMKSRPNSYLEIHLNETVLNMTSYS